VIKTTKFSLWLVPKFAQQIQNGGWPPFENVNCNTSATVWQILMKFGMTMHIRPPKLMGDQKFENFAVGGHLKSQEIAIYPNRLADFVKILHDDTY